MFSNNSRSPHLTKLLSDFTLGFSDGLTVPFALTAGLSSLGSSSTVIYAGLAELCAGSISMGIGGYLAAQDELPCPPPPTDAEQGFSRRLSRRARGHSRDEKQQEGGEKEEAQRMLYRMSSSGRSSTEEDEEEYEKTRRDHDEEDHVRRYLEPLALSDKAISFILADLRLQPGGLPRAIPSLISEASSSSSLDAASLLSVTPVVSGVAISAGYLTGGIIPLIPYFFAPAVGVGLQWSIGLCLLALYLYGSGKSWLLSREGDSWRVCVFKGLQMLVLGGLAAAAAVVCVKVLDSGAGPGED